MPTALDWKNSGIVPTAGLLAWYMHDTGNSSNDQVFDYSGNNRHMNVENPPFPVINQNVVNGQPGWFFDGSANPMVYGGPAVTIRHLFILISCTDPLFTETRGIVSDPLGQTILTGQNGSDNFFDLSGTFPSVYRKTNVTYPANNQDAPVSGNLAVVEVEIPAGIVFSDGIQIGQQINITARKHKGYFVEALFFSTLQSKANRERMMLYFNLKFAQHKVGMPFLFPSDDLMDFRRSRFYAEPPNFSKITDSYEFEDGGKTFNEVGDTAPRRWEYDYLNRTSKQIIIFDEFYAQARLANPFIFRDKYGTEHPNVRIESYSRTHDAHKSWKHNVRFKLVKYPG